MQVELAELPGGSMIDKASVRAKGSGYCSILHVSYSDEAKKMTKPELVRADRYRYTIAPPSLRSQPTLYSRVLVVQ